MDDPSTANDAQDSTGPVPAIQLWSGGKDSSYALWITRTGSEIDVQALATTVTEGPGRSTAHGVRTELMHRQAQAIGLPFFSIPVASVETQADVHDPIIPFLRTPEAAPYPVVVWGDLYWEDARLLHDQTSEAAGKRAAYPLWEVGRNPLTLARAVIGAGFQAVVTSIDTRDLDASFVGRAYDETFLADLPAEVDPCGERGEFHTFVWDGPIFRHPVRCERTRIARNGFHVFCDVAPLD